MMKDDFVIRRRLFLKPRFRRWLGVAWFIGVLILVVLFVLT